MHCEKHAQWLDFKRRPCTKKTVENVKGWVHNRDGRPQVFVCCCVFKTEKDFTDYSIVKVT